MRSIKNTKVICLILSVIVLVAASNNTFAQINENACDCADLLDETVSKIEMNYIAYHVEIKGKRDVEYQTHVNTFKKAANKTTLDKCVPLLQEFVNYFRDGHLFVGQSPKLTDKQIFDLKAKAEKIAKSEAEIKDYLAKNSGKLDPIEGFWYASDGSRFATFRDRKPRKRDFVAVLLSEDVDNWEKGQVKAEFTKLKDGTYDVVFYNDKHYPLHMNSYKRGKTGGARISRGLILHMAPVSWGKKFPSSNDPLNKLDSSNPRLPQLHLVNSSNVLISIPSHDPAYATVLQKLIESNKTEIENAENLIIDLRGNEGGSSWVTNVLMPFIETEQKRPAKYWAGDEQIVLSSNQNLKYFRSIESQGWLPKNLIKRLEANPGRVIPFADPDTKNEEAAAKVKELSKPRNIAILMDDAIVSAGEAFIIKAMRNRKVTLFGQPTAGVIDYQSTYIIGYQNCPHMGLYLGYPMFAASNRLPAGGVNRIGIVPDVPIGKNEKDPISYIINYYQNGPAK